MATHRPRPFLHPFLVVVGILALLAARHLLQLQQEMGPHTQRVNVRFIDGVSDDARRQFERETGLVEGEERVPQTWTYRLIDQSPRNIGVLIGSSLVEDTAHIDRDTLRVVVDLPDFPGWLRDLVQQEWLPVVARALIGVGLALIVLARRGIQGAVVWFARWCRRTVPAVLDSLARLADRLEALHPRHEAAASVALCVVFLLPLLIYGPVDDEEGGLGVFSSLVYYRDLFLRGRGSYWLADLGFGTPMPLGHRLDLHPFFGLGSLVSLRVALSSLWIVQTAIMAVYFRRLAAVSGFGPGPRLVLLASYLFSIVAFFNYYETDWVSCVVPWSLYPAIVYYLRDAFTGRAASRWWLTTVRLGLLFSLWILNAHPGYLVPLAIVLAVYVLIAAPRAWAAYAAVAMAGLFALAASAERIYFVMHEKALFPADVPRMAQPGFGIVAYLLAQARPLVGRYEMRLPFLGAFMFSAALASIWRWRAMDAHIRGCIGAFVAALVLSMTPVRIIEWSGVSGMWLFRDPMVFFGLLSAGAVLQWGLLTRKNLARAAVMALVVVQGAQQTAVIGEGFRRYFIDRNRLEFYRHQFHPTGVGKALVDTARHTGGRLYLSPSVDELSRGRLSRSGVHLVTDYSLLGLNPVNGWFKNVSMDRIAPSPALMHGLIRGSKNVIANASMLDVLGIDMVVANAKEALAPAGLTRLERLRVNSELQLDVFANPNAWPEAVLVSPHAREVALPVVDGCGHTAALCRDYAAFAMERQPGDVILHKIPDGFQVKVPPAATKRLLFISSLYRPEWVATAADRTLELEMLGGAFLGVTIPGGISTVQLSFRPVTRVALTWLSGATLLALVIATGLLCWREERAGPARPR